MQFTERIHSRNSNLDLNSNELRLDDYADSRTPVLDQVAFRMDWNAFLNQHTARTRAAIELLAAGYSRKEVSEYLGVTPAAITQRMARVEKDWIRYSA
jgi:DNA-directed RNA polymerase specialized sigma24 family protein